MDAREIAEIRAALARPAGKDYDVRCENGSCIKASTLSMHTEELLDEVERLRGLETTIAAAKEKLSGMIHAADAANYAESSPFILPTVLDQWRRARDGALADLAQILQVQIKR